jgi:N-acetylmuramoyl-L-alanine amidase
MNGHVLFYIFSAFHSRSASSLTRTRLSHVKRTRFKLRLLQVIKWTQLIGTLVECLFVRNPENKYLIRGLQSVTRGKLRA